MTVSRPIRVFGNSEAARHAGIPGVTAPPAPPAQDTEALRQLRAERDLLKAELERVRFAEGPYGVVLRVRDRKALCVVGGRQYQTVTLHDHADVEIGDAVRFARTEKGLALAEVVKQPVESCPIVVVKAVLSKRRFECFLNGGPRTVRLGKVEEAKPGDRLIVDPDGQIAFENLGPEKLPAPSPEPVEWDAVGGLEEAKRELREAIEDPIVHRDLYRILKLKPPRGILLHGKPGNGKTLIVRAAATALARLHGASAQATGFLAMSGPQSVLNKFVGESEANILKVFETARQHHREHGYPAIVFIDEADALLGKRGSRPWDGMERTIVPTFLTEMDGLDTAKYAPLVILATNRPDILDDAIMRPGRIDRIIEIGDHDGASARRIVEIHVEDRPMEEGLVDAILASVKLPSSGAVLANQVSLTIARAIRRAKDGGAPKLLIKDVP
jgi:proteasome-associated ATPase